MLPTANCQLPTANYSAFTLIEILVVVMLLTVLMLTAFPAFRGLERTTNRHRAVAEADALAQAALAYRRTYGQWPLEDQAEKLKAEDTAIVAGRGVEPQHLVLSDVVAVLRNVRSDHNPRRMLFLELPDDRFDDDDGTPLDPWGHPYVLVMARVGSEDGKGLFSRQEGGVSNRVAVANNATKVIAEVDGPEDAAAFSWGDPASTDAKPWLFSWSKR